MVSIFWKIFVLVPYFAIAQEVGTYNFETIVQALPEYTHHLNSIESIKKQFKDTLDYYEKQLNAENMIRSTPQGSNKHTGNYSDAYANLLEKYERCLYNETAVLEKSNERALAILESKVRLKVREYSLKKKIKLLDERVVLYCNGCIDHTESILQWKN